MEYNVCNNIHICDPSGPVSAKIHTCRNCEVNRIFCLWIFITNVCNLHRRIDVIQKFTAEEFDR